MARPTLRQLEYFIALAETLHFTQAAQKLNVSQPTLSVQIKDLEARLGVSLFDRERQYVQITPIGAELADRARQILSAIQSFSDAATRAAGSLGGVIRLGVLPTLGPYLLPHAIPLLRQRHSDLRLHVREDRPRMLERELGEGAYDLLLTTLPVDDPRFKTKPLFRERLSLVVPIDYLGGAGPISSADLQGASVLTLGEGHRLFEQVRDLAAGFRGVLRTDYEGTSLDSLRQMVGMGMGVSFFPELYIASEIVNDRQVRAAALTDLSPERVVGLVWRASSARAADFHAFGATLAETARARFADRLAAAEV